MTMELIVAFAFALTTAGILWLGDLRTREALQRESRIIRTVLRKVNFRPLPRRDVDQAA